MGDDVPLPGTGVLCLVDQHVIDAAIELVMHPAGGHVVQHRKRVVDQIVIVEQAARLLLAPVVRRRRGCDLQQRLGPVAGRDRTAALDQRSDAVAFQIEQTRNRRMGVTEFFRHHRFTGRAFVGEKYPEIFLHLGAADGVQGLPKPRGVALLGLAAAVEACRDFLPARSRQVGSVDDLALDLFDAVGGIDIERGRDLRRGGVGAAGAVGPCHEVIAAQAALAMATLSARPAALLGSREASSNTLRLARSIISFWSRSSITEKRAGTLASNGNCCSSRVQSAWMVCTFNPPGVSSAQANSSRARILKIASGRVIPASMIAASSALSSSVTQWPRVENTRSAILAAAALVKVMQRIFSGGTPLSNSRITRCTSTCVLPDPALAETNAEDLGSDARACVARTASGIWRGAVTILRSPARRPRTIP